MLSAANIIEEKGGAIAVARTLSCKPGAVRVWKHRNRFPRTAWSALNAAYPELTLPVLEALDKAPSQGSA
jgi:hypothetical protein